MSFSGHIPCTCKDQNVERRLLCVVVKPTALKAIFDTTLVLNRVCRLLPKINTTPQFKCVLTKIRNGIAKKRKLSIVLDKEENKREEGECCVCCVFN